MARKIILTACIVALLQFFEVMQTHFVCIRHCMLSPNNFWMDQAKHSVLCKAHMYHYQEPLQCLGIANRLIYILVVQTQPYLSFDFDTMVGAL